MIKIELELSTNIKILLIVENGTRGGISHAVLWLTKINNRKFDESRDTSSNLTYLETEFL